MSRVRVLVGTRKGAFVLTSDGKREQLGRERPALRRLGDVSPQGLAGRSEPALRVAVQRLVRAADPALRRRRQDVGAGRQQVRLRRRARHAPVVRRHAAPVGVQARLAPRAVADRSRHRVRRRRRRRAVPARPTAADLAGALRAARATARARVAAGRGRHVPAHDPARSRATRSASSSPSRPRARSAPTTAATTWQPINHGLRSEVHPRPGRRGRPLRAPHRHAPVAAERAVHAEALGRDAQRRRRRLLARGQRQPADRLRLPDRRARARAGDDLRRADQERLRALPARRQAARLPQPHRRQRVGSAHQRPAAAATATSTCCATRWPSTRSTRAASTSARPAGRSTPRPMRGDTGRRSCAICRPCCRSKCRRCHDPRRAARASAHAGATWSGEVQLDVDGRCTQRLGPRRARSALSRCCAARSATTSRSKRRPFVRFFACEQDLSHDPPDAPLPEPVASGAEPFLVVGAMAGG